MPTRSAIAIRPARLLTLLTLAALLALTLPTQAAPPAMLAQDIRTTPNRERASYPRQLTVVGNLTYFTASDSRHGEGLWRTDGTAAGTMLLKDFVPGPDLKPEYTFITNLTNVNGTLFFTVRDHARDTTLWKSNGTPDTTVEIKNLGALSLDLFTAVGSTLFFFDRIDENDLWTSDGTADGTVHVTFVPSTVTSSVSANGRLFFMLNSKDLWTSDGTADGTGPLRDFAGIDTHFLSAHGKLFLIADDGIHGAELWTSDGTPAGTMLVKDIRPGALDSSIAFYAEQPAAVVNGTLYFFADDGAHGYELWKSDGTAVGTVLVKDLIPGAGELYPRHAVLAEVKGTLFFGASGRLWKSDGAARGTSLVKSGFVAYNSASGLSSLTNVNGMLFFVASDGGHGFELWRSDGTDAGTVMVRNIDPSPEPNDINDPIPESLVNFNGVLLFTADDGVYGRELWRSDGTADGTALVRAIGSIPGGSYPQQLTRAGARLFFIANDTQLWVTDGNPNGARMLKEPIRDFVHFRADLTAVGDSLFFTAPTPTGLFGLWKSDGTPEGTVLVKEFYDDVWILNELNGQLLLAQRNSLWISDGSLQGTRLLLDFSVIDTIRTNNAFFFTSIDNLSGEYQLWKNDGTAAGTTRIAFDSGVITGSIDLLGAVGDLVLFLNQGGLWASDGSSQGTVKLASGFFSYVDRHADVVGNALFFFGWDVLGQRTLWKSDGTAAGTVLIKIFPTFFRVDQLLSAGDRLFFVADDSRGDRGLWVSDGTTSGTSMVMDIASGPTIGAINGVLLFGAVGQHGDYRIWRSDGTPQGTYQALDLMPPVTSNNLYRPTGLVALGEQVFFSADDLTTGQELWALQRGVDAYTHLPALLGVPAAGIVQVPLTYGNHGLDAGSGVLTVTLSSGLTYLDDTSGISPTVRGATVTWPLPPLGPLARGGFTLRLRAPDAALGTRYPLDVYLAAPVDRDAADNVARLEVMVAYQSFLPISRR